MKRRLWGIPGIRSGLTVLAAVLSFSSASARAAPAPETESAPAPEAPPMAAPDSALAPVPAATVAPPPVPPASPATSAPPAPPPTSAKAGHLRFETGSPRRDSYDGPPLLLGRGKKMHVGGYFGVGAAYTRLMDRDSGLMSFEAALLLEHRLSLGVAGYGFTRTPRGPLATDGTAQEFGAAYGGFALRYSVFGSSPVYATFGLVLGGGAINLHRDDQWHDEADWGDWDDDEWDAGRLDPFLFVQPEIALNANATRWLRLGLTGGYRFSNGVGRFGLSNADLNGVVIGGNIQLGWF